MSRSTEPKIFRATLIGGIAVLLWSLLALFTTGAKGLPPFQLLSMTFAVAFLVSIAILPGTMAANTATSRCWALFHTAKNQCRP